MCQVHVVDNFNPIKFNYTHTVFFVDRTTAHIIACEGAMQRDFKQLADLIGKQYDKPIAALHEVLPDGEIVQELDFATGKHERFISDLSAKHKRAAMCAPTECFASVV